MFFRIIQNKELNQPIKIALVGNPNCGKTTIFNLLTGLNQKVGNFPGVTVNKKSGKIDLPKTGKAELIDLPGTYSLSSKSEDEKIVQDILLNNKHSSYPDVIVLILDATNLKRNLFLATQVLDLGIPCITLLNMEDELTEKGIEINLDLLSKKLDCNVFSISGKLKKGVKEFIEALDDKNYKISSPFIPIPEISTSIVNSILEKEPSKNQYAIFKLLNNGEEYQWLNNNFKSDIDEFNYNTHAAELFEINNRYTKINLIINETVKVTTQKEKKREKIEKLVTHPIYGSFIFLIVFFTLFQTVFILSSYPMEWIESGMDFISNFISQSLPKGYLNSFIVDGLLAGIGGTVIFLPQIMLLFGFITILEDIGYLSRISFISDKLLSYFGMNGKSIIPLVGGFACAVPAIMATRNIESKKERFITLFITPLMSCSARLPVYIFLVSYIVPEQYLFGIINLQGLFMMGLYLLGIIISLLIAIIINSFMNKEEESSFILELPNFKIPNFKNVTFSMLNKGKTFLKEAGKIIIIVSIILWFLSSFGPSEQRQKIEDKYNNGLYLSNYNLDEVERMKSSELLEKSYIGYVGKTIEPVIKPLGFDWKIGIALITSFAAREVFVGTMETIYSIEGGSLGSEDIDFSLPTALSLIIFYVFAMQCMSTLAIVKQETGSWKIAIFQFVIFTGIAYLGSLITYQILT